MESIRLFIVLTINILIAYCRALKSLLAPTRKQDITGQNVLITGAGHGLGREMALKFASKGANLILVDINEVRKLQECLDIFKAPIPYN